MLYELAIDPKLQDELREELATAGDLTFDDMNTSYPLLDAVLKEVLRMHPPILENHHEVRALCNKSFVLNSRHSRLVIQLRYLSLSRFREPPICSSSYRKEPSSKYLSISYTGTLWYGAPTRMYFIRVAG